MQGKCTEPVKTHVTFDFKDKLVRFWRERGYQSESDFVREALIVVVEGPKFLTDLHRDRIEALARNLSEIGPGGDR